MIASLFYTNLCIDFPDVSTCISPINYEGLHRGIRSSTVWFDSLNILYSLQVTTLRNLRKKYVDVFMPLYSACWLLVMRVFIGSIINNSWQSGLIKKCISIIFDILYMYLLYDSYLIEHIYSKSCFDIKLLVDASWS